MSDSITILEATKIIRGRTVLDHVSLSLTRGGIFGFTGINGSGKTMLFHAISGLIHLTSGSIEVFGERVGQDVDFPSSMGLAFESTGFWNDKSGLDNLLRLASINSLVGREEAERALIRMGLDPRDNRRVSSYSNGMKQRLTIAQAIMEMPALLILDEPTNSLDSEGIRLLVKAIHDENNRGATILVSSHNSPEVEALFDQTLRMSDGHLDEVTGHE